MASVKTLLIRSRTEIAFHEVPLLRGAVINMPEVKDILFHNHVGKGFRYGYPLVQYKRLGGTAAILFIGEGTDKVGEFFKHTDMRLTFGEREVAFEPDDISAYFTNVQTWGDSFLYTVRKCLPLNQCNYVEFRQAESLVNRYSMVERSLIGDILSFGKGVGIHFDERIKASLREISGQRQYSYKGVRMMGCDITFSTNVSLPDYIGLGKGTSIGYGMLKRININE